MTDTRMFTVEKVMLSERVRSYAIDHDGALYRNEAKYRFSLEEDSLAARLQREQLAQWESETDSYMDVDTSMFED